MLPGNWIAFRQGKYVFNKSGKWIGWLPWDEKDVVDTNGQYLGTIFESNRLYRLSHHSYRGYPGYPGFAGYSPLPSGTSDVELEA